MTEQEVFWGKKWGDLRDDTCGNISVVLAVMAMTLILGAGAAYDISQASKARMLAQIAADSMALTASIAASNDRSDRFDEGVWYDYGDIGGASNEFTDSMVGKVRYGLQDDDGNRYIETKITGSYQTIFMSMIGTKSIPVAATASVTYAEDRISPASVFLILDNSGSMNFDDTIDTVPANDYYESVSTVTGAEPRLDGLKSTSKSLMDTLAVIQAGVEPGEPRVLRTAMWPYESEIKNGIAVDPDWGTISDSDIDAMVAEGGTNSYNPLSEAWTKLQLEPSIHDAESGVDDPQRFVIFMTDGVNDLCEMQPKEGHYHWRIWLWFYGWWEQETEPGNTSGWTQVWVDDGEEETEVCNAISPFNQTTLDTCTAMKDAGVTVFTIGYSLEPGRYHRNDGINNWTNTDYDRYHYVLEEGVSQTAHTLLQSCASSNEHFQMAKDADALNDVFDKIGELVVKEVIRIKS